MVKLRSARYCNLKLLLIFLVVYGHLIEPDIWESEALMAQYKGIYLFHMPLFCFLSGLFLTDADSCRRQVLKLLPLYIFLQTFAVFLGNGTVKPLTPYWHLWYLLSCSGWAALGWLWFRLCRGRGKTAALLACVLIGLLAGLHPEIDRECSLSRTLAFLPFFWAGLVIDPQFPWERLRWIALTALVIGVAGWLYWGDGISAVFLYQAAPYGQTEAVWLRLLCYLLGALLCLALLAFMPNRRFPFTRAGADTMPAYLIHAPAVLCLRESDIFWPFKLLITAVFLYATHKLLQWHRGLYGIRREG